MTMRSPSESVPAPASQLLRRRRAPRAQRGVVLLYALIAIVLLMLSGLALVRGMGTALAISGNFALRRDLLNEGEQGVVNAEAAFTGGLLNTTAARNASLAGANYSATTLATDNNGIPNALLSDAAFAAVGVAANDITPENGVSIRYVIDRLC